MKKQIPNWVVSCCIFMLLLTPFMASTNFTDPMLFPKMIYFQILASLIVAAWILFLLINDKLKALWSPDEIILGTFVAWVVFRTLFSSGSEWTNVFMHSWIFLFLIYFIIKRISAQKRLNILKLVYLGTGVLLALMGWAQYFGLIENKYSSFGATGPFINPAPYAMLLGTFSAFSIGLLIFTRHNKIRAFCAVAAMIMLSLLPFTESRTAWVAVLSSVGLLGLLKLNTWIRKFKYLSLLLGLTIAVGIAYVGYIGYHYKKESADGRLFIYKLATRIIQENPVIGVGFDNFGVAFHDEEARYFEQLSLDHPDLFHATSSDFAFNEYLQILAETGIVGFILFVAWVICVFKNGLKDTSRVPFLGGMLSVLVCSLFSYPLHEIPLLICLIFSAALSVSGSKMESQELNVSKIFTKIFLLVTITFLCLNVVRLAEFHKAEIKWKQAFLLLRQGNTNKGLANYEKLYPTLKMDKFFLYNYGVEMAFSGNHQKAIQLLKEAKGRINDSDLYLYLGLSLWMSGDPLSAEHRLKTAIAIAPYKFIPRIQLMQLYLQTDNKEKAISTARKIIELPVKVQSETVFAIKEEAHRLLSQN